MKLTGTRIQDICRKICMTLILSVLLSIQIAPAFFTGNTANAQTRTALPVANEDCKTFEGYQMIVDGYTRTINEEETPAERHERRINAKNHFVNELTRDQQYNVLACAIKSGRFHLFMVPYMIRYFVEVIIQLSGLVCTLFIVIGAYQYLIGSVTENKQKGKDTIKNALIGLVITLLAWIIVNVVQVALTS